MSKARTLANLISDNAELADGQISVAEVVGAAPLASPTFTADVEVTDGTTPILSLRKTGSDKATIKFDTSNGLQIDNSSYNYPIKFDGSSFVFNEQNNNADFRIEGANNTHLFFVDAGQDEISMGTSANTTYDAKVAITVSDSSSHTDFQTSLLLNDDNTSTSLSGGSILFGGQDGTSSRGFAKIAGGKANSTSGDYGGSLMFKTRVNGDANIEENMRINGSGIVINEISANKDFRVESDNDSHMLFVDASSNRVGIGDSAPSNKLHVNAGSASDIMRLDNSSGGYVFGYTTNLASIDLFSTASLRVRHGSTESMRLKAGEAVFNEIGADIDFRVESDALTHALFVDAGNNLVSIGSGSPYTSGRLEVFAQNDLSSEGISINGVSSATSFRLYTVGNVAKIGRGGDHPSISIDGTHNVIINDDGENHDFRVESDTNSNAIFLDAGAASGNGVVCIGTNDTSVAGNTGSSRGINLNCNGYMELAAYQETVAYFNRMNNDGTIIAFKQNGATEGTISVSGSTVSYNGFAGRHESSGIPTTTARGTVVSTIDELDEYLSGPKQGQTRADHAKVEVSDSVGDPCVYGVVDDFTEDGSVNVVSVGIAPVRVTGSCAKGDLLESNGDGTAKVQSDDIIRSKTIGKVTIGNSDTGVKLVPCVMYCG